MEEFGYISIIRKDGVKGNAFPITTTQIVIGRAFDCDIRIHLPKVSEKHCLIAFKDGRAFCKPLEKSEVFVNNSRLSCDCLLSSGDVIQIADRSLVFDYPKVEINTVETILDSIVESAVETTQVAVEEQLVAPVEEQKPLEAMDLDAPVTHTVIISNEFIPGEPAVEVLQDSAEDDVNPFLDLPAKPPSTIDEGRCTPTPEINAPSAEFLLFSPKKTPTSVSKKIRVDVAPTILSPQKNRSSMGRSALDDCQVICSPRPISFSKIAGAEVPRSTGSSASKSDMVKGPPLTVDVQVPEPSRSPLMMKLKKVSTPKKAVTFGPSLSPEVFDHEEPAASPVRRSTPLTKPIPRDPSKTMLKSVLRRDVKAALPNSAPCKNTRPVQHITVRPLRFSPMVTHHDTIEAPTAEVAPVIMEIDEVVTMKLTPSKNGRMSLGGGTPLKALFESDVGSLPDSPRMPTKAYPTSKAGTPARSSSKNGSKVATPVAASSKRATPVPSSVKASPAVVKSVSKVATPVVVTSNASTLAPSSNKASPAVGVKAASKAATTLVETLKRATPAPSSVKDSPGVSSKVASKVATPAVVKSVASSKPSPAVIAKGTPAAASVKNVSKASTPVVVTSTTPKVASTKKTPKSTVYDDDLVDEVPRSGSGVAAECDVPDALLASIMSPTKSKKNVARSVDLNSFKHLMKTPKIMQPVSLFGLKELVKTPKASEYVGLEGLKHMVKTPNVQEPIGLESLKHMIRTPMPQAELDVKGVKELVKTPRRQTFVGLEAVQTLVQTPDIINAMKSPARSQSKKAVDKRFSHVVPEDIQATMITPDVKSSPAKPKTPAKHASARKKSLGAVELPDVMLGSVGDVPETPLDEHPHHSKPVPERSESAMSTSSFLFVGARSEYTDMGNLPTIDEMDVEKSVEENDEESASVPMEADEPAVLEEPESVNPKKAPVRRGRAAKVDPEVAEESSQSRKKQAAAKKGKKALTVEVSVDVPKKSRSTRGKKEPEIVEEVASVEESPKKKGRSKVQKEKEVEPAPEPVENVPKKRGRTKAQKEVELPAVEAQVQEEKPKRGRGAKKAQPEPHVEEAAPAKPAKRGTKKAAMKDLDAKPKKTAKKEVEPEPVEIVAKPKKMTKKTVVEEDKENAKKSTAKKAAVDEKPTRKRKAAVEEAPEVPIVRSLRRRA